MNKFLQLAYALSVTFSQSLVSFAQIRADQIAIENMTDKQIQALSQEPQKIPIGFNGRKSES